MFKGALSERNKPAFFWKKKTVPKISETTGPISMSLGIFESTMAYLETIFEFFDFGHSKPLFQLQNEVVSTIPGLKMSKMGVCKGISKHWVDFNDLDNLWTLWMPSERYIYELIHFRRSKYADFRLNIRAQTMKLTEDNEDALLMFLSGNAPLMRLKPRFSGFNKMWLRIG